MSSASDIPDEAVNDLIPDKSRLDVRDGTDRHERFVAGEHGHGFDNDQIPSASVPQASASNREFYHIHGNTAKENAFQHNGHVHGNVNYHHHYTGIGKRKRPCDTDELVEEMIESLRLQSLNPRLENISDEYQKTFGWIWDPLAVEGNDRNHPVSGPGLVEWLQSDNPIIWITGLPGAGKSTLMKYIYNDPRTESHLNSVDRPSPTKVFGFSFFELGRPTEKNFVSFLCSLLYQLLTTFEDLSPSVLPLYKRLKAVSSHGSVSPLWTDSLVRKSLLKVFHDDGPPRSICFFVDGFDECETPTFDQLDFLLDLTSRKIPQRITLRLCISSRKMPELLSRLRNFPSFEVSHFTAKDIYYYVQQELSKSVALKPLRNTSLELEYANLAKEVVRSSKGVFLWVKLVVNELRVGIEHGYTFHQLRQRLDSLPPGINNLYTAIFDRIPSYILHDTVNCLEVVKTWYTVNASYRARLNLFALSLILDGPQKAADFPRRKFLRNEIQPRFETMRTRLVSICRNLVLVSTHFHRFDASVYVMHKTVFEYMGTHNLWARTVQRAQQELLFNPSFCVLLPLVYSVKCGVEVTQPWRFTYPAYCDDEYDVESCPNDFTLDNFFLQPHFNDALVSPPCMAFFDQFITHWSHKHPDWLADLELRKDWGCDLSCVAVKYHLPHLLRHRISSEEHPQPPEHLLAHFPGVLRETPWGIDADLESLEILLKNGFQWEQRWGNVTCWSRFLWEFTLKYFLTNQKDLLSYSFNYLGHHIYLLSEIYNLPGVDINQDIYELPPMNPQPRLEDYDFKKVKFPCSLMHVAIECWGGEMSPNMNWVLQKSLAFDISLSARNGVGETVLEVAKRRTLEFESRIDLVAVLLDAQKAVEEMWQRWSLTQKSVNRGKDPKDPRNFVMWMFKQPRIRLEEKIVIKGQMRYMS